MKQNTGSSRLHNDRLVVYYNEIDASAGSKAKTNHSELAQCRHHMDTYATAQENIITYTCPISQSTIGVVL